MNRPLAAPHRPPCTPSAAGSWKLGAGQALTLRPRETGVLRTARGRLWATRDGPHQGRRNDWGDLVVEAGAQLRLRAGERLVIEALNGDESVFFSWDPYPGLARAELPNLAGVRQSLVDLRLALVLGLGAGGRLAHGLARQFHETSLFSRPKRSLGSVKSGDPPGCRAPGKPCPKLSPARPIWPISPSRSSN